MFRVFPEISSPFVVVALATLQAAKAATTNEDRCVILGQTLSNSYFAIINLIH